MKTLTEKYRGVLNESFSKKQFVRDARMAWPQLITQFSGFEDTVTILKQKGMISEEDKMPEYSEFANLSDDAIRRGIDAELEAMGLMSQDSISAEDQAKAKEKALKNLKKNPLHYLNLMSGESNKVDKHDQMVEPNEKNKVDTFNGMKKAELKEEMAVFSSKEDEDKYIEKMVKRGLEKEKERAAKKKKGVEEADAIPTEPGIPGERASNHDRKMAMRNIIDYLTKDGHPDSGHKVSTDDALSFIKTHKDDIFNGDIDANDISDVWSNYDEYETINRDIPEVMGVDRKGNQKPETEPSRFKGRDKSVSRVNASEALSDEDMKAIEKYGHPDKTVKPFKPGDMWSTDFDYEGMLEFGMKIRLNTPIATLQALYNSFEDVNYHSENSHLGMAIDAIEDGDKGEALDHIRNFKKEVKKTLVGINEGSNPNRRELEEAGAVVTERVGALEEFISLIKDRAAESGFSEAEEAEEVIEALQDHYGLNEAREEDDGLRDDPRVDKHGNEEPEDGESSFGEAEVKSHPDEIEDGTFPVAEAFKKVGIDISKDVHVHETDGGTAGLGGGRLKDKGLQSAESVLKMFEGIRKKEIAEYEKNKDKEGYSYEFPIIYEYYYSGDKTPEGKEFKMSFGIFEGTTWDVFQESSVEEKKGKDHDGDGDIDGDDYMAAKDKAIKKAMGKDEIVKENIKAIIQKVLEEGTINEAATQELAKMADSYAGFDGMKAVVISLQDIVTEIEKFYDNTRGKIQKAFDSMGEVRNEEGLKVGGFLAPAVESAFNKDLRPVTKLGFTKGIDQPRVKVLSQADIDAAQRSGTDNRFSQMEEEPKQTVYSPVNEKK